MSKLERNVIVHYHIFKNAGSSVDQLLKKNFADKWYGFDGETPGSVITTAQLEQLIENSPEKTAFSSHQIVPPLPEIDGQIFPVVFLRDPIDRIKSAYLFEWKKQLGLDVPRGTLVEYVTEKFSNKRKSSIEEFQTIRLSNLKPNCFHGEVMEDDEMLGCACEFIDSLKFVGIVDEFERSKQLLSSYLEEGFPGFQISEVKANVLQDLSLSQELKRRQIKEELGSEFFEMIVAGNELDEALYQHGRKRFKVLLDSRVQSEHVKMAG